MKKFVEGTIESEKISIANPAGGAHLQVRMGTLQYDIAFVITVQKAQGATVTRAILSFLRRLNVPFHTFFAVYTMLTRLREGNNFRILADLADLNWVQDLRPPLELVSFFQGYDDEGIWSFDRAHAHLLQLQQQESTSDRPAATTRNQSARGTRGRGRVSGSSR